MASKKKSLFCLLLCLLLSPCWDALAAAPSAQERETARRLMDEGKARMKDKEHARAVDAFQKAHDIMHVPTTGLALARAHLAAGHLVEARDAALEVLRLPREAGEPAVFEQARKQAKELDAQVRPRIPTLRIKIKGNNIVRVAIDDTEISPTIVGEPIPVNPGKRIVSAKNGEGGEAKGEVELGEREAKEIDLILPQHGEMAAKPVVTNAPSSSSTPTTSSTSPGSSASASGKITGFGNDGEDRAGERTPLATGLFYGGVGLGAAGIIVGAVTGIMTLSKASDVEPECANDICAPTAKDNLDSAHTLSSISTIGFIVGGVGAVAVGVSFALPKQRRRASNDQQHQHPRLTVRLGNGVAALGGSF